jgi:uncharacterized metal-binding protein YceD (DUF177 family)
LENNRTETTEKVIESFIFLESQWTLLGVFVSGKEFMPLLINLRHLEKKELHLEGELPISELELENVDELIHFSGPLTYDLEADRLEDALLVQGKLHLPLECECVRCLKLFKQDLDFPGWAAHLPLKGEDKVETRGDFVDLTPYLREDILLAFPQHPLCKANCKGLPKGAAAKLKKAGGPGKVEEKSSPWSKLDKLKL